MNFIHDIVKHSLLGHEQLTYYINKVLLGLVLVLFSAWTVLGHFSAFPFFDYRFP